jgi:hypothetical protein
MQTINPTFVVSYGFHLDNPLGSCYTLPDLKGLIMFKKCLSYAIGTLVILWFIAGFMVSTYYFFTENEFPIVLMGILCCIVLFQWSFFEAHRRR